MKLHFVASSAPAAQEYLSDLLERHGQVPIEEADVVVALGGDGLMLDVLHRLLRHGLSPSVYGVNRGTTSI